MALSASALTCSSALAAAGDREIVPGRVTETAALELGEDVADRIEVSPAQLFTTVEPGTIAGVPVAVTNRTSEPVDLRFYVVDLEAGDRGSFAQPTGGRELGAASGWFEVPLQRARLQPDRRLEFSLGVDVPAFAAPGAHAVAFVASQSASGIRLNSDERVGSAVRTVSDVGSTIVLTLPGKVVEDARIVATRGPRIVWRERAPTFEIEAQNTGRSLLDMGAQAHLDAFASVAKRTLKATDSSRILPRGRRSYELRWSDRPLFGWFRPVAQVVAGDGDVLAERTMPRVFVIPPWWMLALLAGALALPIVVRRRSRRGR